MATRHYKPLAKPHNPHTHASSPIMQGPPITRQGVTSLHPSTNIQFQYTQATPYTQVTPYRGDMWPNDVWGSAQIYGSSGSASWHSPHSASSGTGPSPAHIQSSIMDQYPIHVYEELKQRSSSKKQQNQVYKRLPPMELPLTPTYHQGDVARQHPRDVTKCHQQHNSTAGPVLCHSPHPLTPQHKNTHRYSSNKPKSHKTTSSLSNAPASYEHDPTVRALGPIRDPSPGEHYTDPLCPSNMDYQRRGEDEAAKFFDLVIRHASTLGLKINYEDPEEREAPGKGISQDPTKILGKFSLDFRWQMKHFQFNRTVYSKSVFSGQQIDEEYLLEVSRNLRHIADTMAHKQYLPDSYHEKENVSDSQENANKCGTAQCILAFFQHMITFVDKVLNDLDHIHIVGLEKHSENLKVIFQDLRENLHYQETFHHNSQEYDKLSEECREKKYKTLLHTLHHHEPRSKKESSDWQKMIVIKFASCANLKITDLD